MLGSQEAFKNICVLNAMTLEELEELNQCACSLDTPSLDELPVNLHFYKFFSETFL